MKFVKKGWGSETWIHNCPEYCGKLLIMNAGKQLSWHFHILKKETFWVQKGKVKIIYGDTDDISQAKEEILTPGSNFEVPRGLRHRLVALENSEIFEFSTQHFDSDSIRIIPGD